MDEEKRLQESKGCRMELLTRRQEALDGLEKESKQYVSLINEMNNAFGNWGLDLTSLSEDIGKDYPVSTTIIDQIKYFREDDSSELKLWKLIRKFIPSDSLKVRMDFLAYDVNFDKLLFWGSEFLNMEGLDLLYVAYLLMEQQLQKTPSELDGDFNENKIKILLPKMTATFEKSDFTCMDFSIHGVGNLNIITK